MPIFLEVDEVLDLHQTSIAKYGGDTTVRDVGLLKSAIAQPQAMSGGQYLNPDLASMAASLLFSLVMNHPFVDGNKRTGAAAARVFLLTNGALFDPPNKAYEEMVLAVASGQADKDAATEFFRRHVTV
jgi:death on curing protein